MDSDRINLHILIIETLNYCVPPALSPKISRNFRR